MAVVAVLEIHIENTNPMTPTAYMARVGEPSTSLRDTSHSAARRSKPWCESPPAKKKPPRNKKMIGSPNAASAVLASAAPRSTASAGPSSAATASGIASVTHSTTVIAATPASACAWGVRPGMGKSSRPTSATGASTRPAVRRRRSKRASAALTRISVTSGDDSL
jgi:hypothetical protein